MTKWWLQQSAHQITQLRRLAQRVAKRGLARRRARAAPAEARPLPRLSFWGLRKHFLLAKSISYSELRLRAGAAASETSRASPGGEPRPGSLPSRRGLTPSQPWINKDADLRLKQVSLPKPHAAPRARRGGKLPEEASQARRPLGEGGRGRGKSTQPTSYVPLHCCAEQLKDDKSAAAACAAADGLAAARGEAASLASARGRGLPRFASRSALTSRPRANQRQLPGATQKDLLLL